ADLFGVSLGEGTAKDGEVLRKHKHIPPVDQTVARDHAISGIKFLVQSEVFRTMDHELVKVFKRSFVEQEFDALTRRHLSCFVLLLNTSSAATLLGRKASLSKSLQPRFRLFCFLF